MHRKKLSGLLLSSMKFPNRGFAFEKESLFVSITQHTMVWDTIEIKIELKSTLISAFIAE